MKEAKKKSPARIYLTFAVVLIICGLIGGIMGAGAVSNEFSVRNLGEQVNQLLASLGPWWFAPGLLLLSASTWFYIRGRWLLPQAKEDDEVFPRVNLTLGRAMFLANLSTVFMFLAMAMSYSASWGLVWSVLLLVVHLVWVMTMNARIIAATKQIFPEKQGNVFDFKFQQDWYESCDEAERQQTAQCSYLATIDLVAPTYSLLVGALWLVQQFVYNYTALKLDKARL